MLEVTWMNFKRGQQRREIRMTFLNISKDEIITSSRETTEKHGGVRS